MWARAWRSLATSRPSSRYWLTRSSASKTFWKSASSPRRLEHGFVRGEVLAEPLSGLRHAGGGHVEPAQIGQKDGAVKDGPQ